MKTIRTLSLMFCLLMAVGTVQAQENIKRAIDEFLDDERVNYTESHHKNRNPETGEMEGRLDAYTFTLAPKDLKLLDMLKEAVKKDSEDAYEENWESSSSPEAVYRQRKVMYNDNEGLVIGYEYYNYIQVNFVDKSKEGFRYAYVIEWEKVDDDVRGKKENVGQGRIAIAYARMPQQKKTTVTVINGDMLGSLGSLEGAASPKTMSSIDWLTKFNLYRKNFLKYTQKNMKSNMSTVVATKLYELSKNADCLSHSEAAMCAEQLEKMMQKTDDDMIKTMLNSSIEYLKER